MSKSPPLLKHLIGVDDLNRDILDTIFARTTLNKKHNCVPLDQTLHGKIGISLFYEPSTRTRLSFESAILRLGGQVIGTENAKEFSSTIKGETLEDTIQVLNSYSDIIILRYHETGGAVRAAAVSEIPVINAGDGKGQHPSQTALDLFTIDEKFGAIDGRTIGLAGDLLNGRTVHSLASCLARYYEKVKMILISPPALSIPLETKATFRDYNVDFEEYDNFREAPIKNLDCLYMTRIQKERFDDQRDYEDVKDSCILTPNLVDNMKKDAIILHPLPRVNEIPTIIDQDPRAYYFKQAANGLPLRISLLELMLN